MVLYFMQVNYWFKLCCFIIHIRDLNTYYYHLKTKSHIFLINHVGYLTHLCYMYILKLSNIYFLLSTHKLSTLVWYYSLV